MKVRFVAGVAPIVPDVDAAKRLYRDALGLPLRDDEYPATFEPAEAAAELEARGYGLLHGAKTEPSGQTVARLFGPEGLLVGLSCVPWYRQAEIPTETGE